MDRSLLNPCDYFLLMLDESIRRDGLAGNTCVAEVVCEEPPTLQDLEDFAVDLVRRYPRLEARLKVSWLPRRTSWRHGVGGGIPVREVQDASEILNEPMDPRSDAPMALYRTPVGMAVRWHHALMDAKGGERVLCGEESDIPPGEEYQSDLARVRWWTRLKLARSSWKNLREIDGRVPDLFPHDPSGTPSRYDVRHVRWSAEETSAIQGRGVKATGPMLFNLYLLGSVVTALSEVVVGSRSLVVPLPVGLRTRLRAPVVANYLSFLQLEVPRGQIRDVTSCARYLKSEHLQQIRYWEDVRMICLLDKGRWLSLGRYLKERTSREGRERASVYYSFPGESSLTSILGRKVLEHRVYSAIPARPGIGVFFGLSQGKLWMTSVSVRGIVDEEARDRFLKRLGEIL